MANNQTYTKGFRTGMLAACNAVTLDQVTAIANALPDMEGKAMLAGYHAELRGLRAARETEDIERSRREAQ